MRGEGAKVRREGLSVFGESRAREGGAQLSCLCDFTVEYSMTNYAPQPLLLVNCDRNKKGRQWGAFESQLCLTREDGG